MTTHTHPADPAPVDTDPAPSNNLASLKDVLTDPAHDRSTNLLQLQGWRGDKLDESARTAAFAHKLAPAACGTLSLIAALTGSMALVLATLSTALIGTVARNHPFEMFYNAIARRSGRQAMPANRAAKRLGCAIGSAFLGGAAIAWSVGLGTLATVLLVTLGSLATFVAITGLCVPSMMFVLLFGADRSTRCRLILPNA